ncbi:hypothetical protein QF001_007422 [Paraburkholderia youngii]|uniref:Uncharacterized protein n=1 Tax=Paraburkholderia youngii TaxID=2782701 RepID=A0A7Y6N0H5_9BURK|nr:hypothetical protein [Paraburkholderia youngii]NUY02927.1 hypothetical protein [Paraburkholderia youngii]
MVIDFKVGAHRRCTLYTRREYRGNPLSDEARTGRQLITSAASSEFARDSRQLSRLLQFMRDARLGAAASGAAPEQLVRVLQAAVERGDVIAVASKSRASSRRGASIDQEIRPYYETVTPSQLFRRALPVVRARNAFQRPVLPRLAADDDLAIWFARPGDVLPDGTIATPVSTPLGDAQAFDYQSEMPGGAADEVAGMPFKGAPGTWISSMPGTMPQLRQFGPNGTPLTDFDLEAHHGNPNPHAHNWDGYIRDEGAPVSLLPW